MQWHQVRCENPETDCGPLSAEGVYTDRDTLKFHCLVCHYEWVVKRGEDGEGKRQEEAQ